MRYEIKRIRELEKSLRSNGNVDMQDEYLFLHAKLHRPFPKDFVIEDEFDISKKIPKHSKESVSK